ncbi:MAG: hypothetical protein LR008_01125 [Candidatus Pacebacteria bacterium]|nr:hypothetical protein [Candidatus Paceibacterota bacterium]
MRKDKDIPTSSISTQLINLKQMFDQMGVTYNTSKIVLPDGTYSFERLLINPRMLSLNIMIEELKLYFNVSEEINDIGSSHIREDRSSRDGSYAVLTRNRTDSGDQYGVYKNGMNNISSITLLEHMIYTLVYYRETGFHLDTKTPTTCFGSCTPSGIVPSLFWNADRNLLDIKWDFAINYDLQTRLVTF